MAFLVLDFGNLQLANNQECVSLIVQFCKILKGLFFGKNKQVIAHMKMNKENVI